MTEKELQQLVWENVSELMRLGLGGEALGDFSRRCGFGASTMTRIKAQETAVGIDVVAKIAAACHISPWQVLAPKLGENLYSVDGKKITPAFERKPFEMHPPQMDEGQPHLVSEQKASNVSMKRNRASKHEGDSWMQSSTELRAVSKPRQQSKPKPEGKS